LGTIDCFAPTEIGEPASTVPIAPDPQRWY
jgi:hypothetical protein